MKECFERKFDNNAFELFFSMSKTTVLAKLFVFFSVYEIVFMCKKFISLCTDVSNLFLY